jgi:DNA polymerase III subunit alpha
VVAPAFVHTHVHSHYSLLDGAAQVADLVKAAAACGQPALALTDHGNLAGSIEFYKACVEAGVKPILGLEAYLAPRSRHDRTKNPVVAHHLILLAQNLAGWKNLLKLSSRSFTEGFWYVPRLDKELLAKHSEGLIAQSACLSGEPCYYLRCGDRARAVQAAAEMKAIFGDRYYLEIQRNGCDGQEEVNQGLLSIGRELRIPVVATNDVHYVGEDDRAAHEVHMCIGMGKTLKDANRLKPQSLLCYKASDPMYALFKDVEEAPRSTLDIAARCDLKLDLKSTHLPIFTAPDGQDNVVFFRRLCREGAERRYGSPLPPAAEARLASEAEVIEQTGFVSYFLIVWDFIRFAKERGIPVGPGRGSAAGSLVAYSLGITNVDPLAHDLLFERFLNRERVSMPDIDIDFCKDGREEVIRYVRERYGSDRVSQIVTFGTMAARAVIRDVGRVLDVPLRDVDALAKKVPNGPNASLAKALETDADLAAEVEHDERFRELMSIARRLEGLNRNASKHAAGVVIADAPLEEYVPLYRVGEDVTTQFTMEVLEELGLLKMDFLGLRTLTILAKALEIARRQDRTPPDLDRLPADDPATFAMLSRGEAQGVFQLESSGMRDLLVRIRPDRFADLSAILALFRPGPLGSGMVDQFVERKNGRQPTAYLHPSLEPILAETLGVICYQEQVMRIANVLGGFTLNEADTLRKAMGKKKPEVMAPFREKFVQGGALRGIPEAAAAEIWKQMEYFAGYGFNKSHTVAYAVVSYQTAWMKCHEPHAFLAALLTCECGDRDTLSGYLDECRRMGIRVLPPDVSSSHADFSVEGDAIRFGLAAVKGVGEGAAAAIVAAREAGGPFTSVFDLCERVPTHTLNRATLEALVRGGAFDATGVRRAQAMEVLDRALALASEAHQDRAVGQSGLFGAGPAAVGLEATPGMPDVPEWPLQELLAHEKDALGYYVTSHPLAKHEATLRRLSTLTSSTLATAQEKQVVRLGGIVAGLRTSVIKNGPNEGKKMAFFRLEDFTGGAPCVMFSKAYAEQAARLANDRVVLCEGDVDASREEPTLRVNKVVPIEDAPHVFAKGVLVRLSDATPEAIEGIRGVLRSAPGPLPIAFELRPDPRSRVVVKAGPAWNVVGTPDVLARLSKLPGVRDAEWLAVEP